MIKCSIKSQHFVLELKDVHVNTQTRLISILISVHVISQAGDRIISCRFEFVKKN